MYLKKERGQIKTIFGLWKLGVMHVSGLQALEKHQQELSEAYFFQWQ